MSRSTPRAATPSMRRWRKAPRSNSKPEPTGNKQSRDPLATQKEPRAGNGARFFLCHHKALGNDQRKFSLAGIPVAHHKHSDSPAMPSDPLREQAYKHIHG